MKKYGSGKVRANNFYMDSQGHLKMTVDVGIKVSEADKELYFGVFGVDLDADLSQDLLQSGTDFSRFRFVFNNLKVQTQHIFKNGEISTSESDTVRAFLDEEVYNLTFNNTKDVWMLPEFFAADWLNSCSGLKLTMPILSQQGSSLFTLAVPT